MDSGDLIAEMLVGYGVRYVFGIPGGQTLPLYNAIGRRPEQIRHVLIRDERSGPYAADAYARVARRLAVCDAVPGPGVVKLPSGLAEAHVSSVPLVAIAGDIATSSQPLARYSCAAQGLDQLNLLRPVCKSVIPVNSQAALPGAVRQAFREATTGRPGPTVLDIPDDVFHAGWDPEVLPAAVEPSFGSFPATRVRPAAGAVEAAARALLSARRPVMAVGGGGLLSGATREVQALAEALNMPVVTSVTGKGTMSEEHPLCAGVLGGQYGEESANTVVREADVVLMVGFKSSQQSTFSWKLPTADQKVIHLDVDPYEIGKVFPTEIALAGDATAGLQDLLQQVLAASPAPPARKDWLSRLAEVKAQWQAEVEGEMQPRSPIRPQQLVAELQRQMAPEDIMVTDASFSIGWITSFYQVRSAGRRCLFPRGSATLGFGLPASIGARLAAPPEQRVVCLAGDGGFGYALGELATCRKYNLRVTVVVLNNAGLGYSRWVEKLGEGRYENVEFPPTDFAMIARGFGCAGLKAESPDDIGDVLKQALNTDGPVVVDAAVDRWETPELLLRQKQL